MEGKLYSFNIIIYILVRVCSSINAVFTEQPYPLAFHVAPGIQSFSNRYKSLSRSDEEAPFIDGLPSSSGSDKSPPSKGVQSSHGTIIMPGHVGSSSFHKQKIPGIQTGSGSGNNDQMLFPSGNLSRTQNVSPPSTGKPSSNKSTVCKIEKALVDYDGECYKLFTQGPCSPNQWFIIDKEEPSCVRRPCPEGELFYNEKCVNISDTSVCGTSEILYVQFTGDVYCDCLQYYVYDPEGGKCFAENGQGSCPFGQFLDLDSNDKVRCIENPCKTDDLVYNPKDMSCYKKDYIGSCKEKGHQIVYYKDRTATCISIYNKNIFEVEALPCRAGSKRDYFDKCQKVLNPRSKQSHSMPSHRGSMYRKCRPGEREFPDGSCRKNILGG